MFAMIVNATHIPGDQTLTERKIVEDKPPPYRELIVPSQTTLPSSSGILSPTPSVNQVHLNSKNDDITGTFHIDPQTPCLDASLRKRGKKTRNKKHPHASFQTRHGNVKIDIGTTGNSSGTERALVQVSSRSGNITINMLSIPAQGPRMGLEVDSRKGNLVVFFPESFAGVIQLLSKRGDLTVLPALEKRISVLKDNGKEMMLSLTPAPRQVGDSSIERDLCQLLTRHGKIIIGLSGKDNYTPKVTFWKRMIGAS